MEKYLYSLFTHFKKVMNAKNLSQAVSSDNIILRDYYIKNESRIFFLSDFTEIKKGYLKEILIYGFWNDLVKDSDVPSDYLILEAGLKLNCSGIPVEIRRIHAGKIKRSGKGSAALKFLEESIIPQLNRILKEQGIDENIRYIYGTSAELCNDTDYVSRAKFYSKNGYILSSSHFYKYFNK